MVQTKENSLLPREWLSLVLLVAVLAVLSAIAWLTPSPSLPEPAQAGVLPAVEEVVVRVSGEVDRPGDYRVAKGTCLQELLDRAGVRDTADLRRFKLQRQLVRSQQVTLRRMPQIKIKIDGAVEAAGDLILPQGTRVCELINYINLADNADPASLRFKRRLKNGETIRVGRKGV